MLIEKLSFLRKYKSYVKHMKALLQVIIFAILTLGSTANAQSYQWENVRSRVPLSEKEQVLPELILKDHTQYDYFLENDQFLMYAIKHKIILVNNSEAVQRNNRINISMTNTVELVDVKARAISKNGKVTLFDKSNLKELKDEERSSGSRIFAIEGAEIGSEIEYYYIKKMKANSYHRA